MDCMADNQFDPAAIKAQQREQWSSAAEGWREHWGAFERAAQPLSDRLIQLARVGPGQRLLDIATGIGEPAMTAAKAVGPSGKVVAVDQAPQMLAVARERAQAAGVQNIEFVEGDAEIVDLPPDSFDAAVCRWGLFFFPDPVGFLARVRASLVPGGRFAAAVWGPPERVPLISFPFAVLSREFGQPPAAPGGASPFALSDPATLEQVVRNAGFADVASEPFTVTFEFDSLDELLSHLRDVSAPIRTTMAKQSAERQAELWGKLADAAVGFAGADGIFRLSNECLIVSGRR
jgi:ubiquinone/menaquinone biosynthesis C-methylase UbiE